MDKGFFTDICTVDHESPDQIKRQQKALSQANNPFEIDKESKTGKFYGSKNKIYETTLEHCTCVDFGIRKLPCKHIYKLAYELNIINLPETLADNDSENNKNKAKSLIKNLSREAKEILRDFMYSHKKIIEKTKLNNFYKELLENQIIFITEDNKIKENSLRLELNKPFTQEHIAIIRYLNKDLGYSEKSSSDNLIFSIEIS